MGFNNFSQLNQFVLLIFVPAIYLAGVVCEENVRTLDLVLPWVQIPAKQTYYVCQQFEMPTDQPYHVIKFEAMVNNTETVHHMLLFGCEFQMDTQGPHPCDDLDNRCRSWLVKWDTGMPRERVLPQEAGARIGNGSFKYLLLQVHWNNVGSRHDRTDNSGFRLHYTSDLRQHDIGNVQVGQTSIEIPHNSREMSVSGSCASSCTAQMLPRAVNISQVYLHMHGLGLRASFDIIRDREVVDRLAIEDNYNYTRPIIHVLHENNVVHPGDEIKLTCWYSTVNERQRNETTSYGQGTHNAHIIQFIILSTRQSATVGYAIRVDPDQMAEMCYAFVQYYPRMLGFDQCLQRGLTNMNC